MTAIHRSLIETTLKGMEAGRFQDFCLEFLPVWDHRFVGLSRYGHTAAGKTRPGTPDLIKTNPDGTQIAVQCGTNEYYWKPTKDYDSWKPCEDAQKCIEALDRPVEIILASNHELSTHHPNSKTEIISYLKNKTIALITLLSLEDISQFIFTTLHEAQTKRLLERYFIEVFTMVSTQEDAQKYRIAADVASQRPIQASALFELVGKALQVSTGAEAKKYVIEKMDSLPYSIYRINPLPPFVGIRRESVKSLPLKTPLGKVWVLSGVPKIGKTSLLLQLVEFWAVDNIRWYDCPIDDHDCSIAIALDLIKTILPAENAEQLLKSRLMFESALKDIRGPSNPVVFVIDNANHLSEEGLKQIAQVLAAIKRHGLIGNVAFVFVTNKNLQPFLMAVDEELVVPAWSVTELSQLLQFHEIQFDTEDSGKYLESLSFFSGGHPLLAVALARKHPTVPQLVLNQLGAVPALEDETLSREVQLLLYNDILTEADSQNLVQRLSILVGRVPEEVLEALRKDVFPQIMTSSSVIIDRVGRSLVEGDPKSGYSVSFVFREIAKQKITEHEKQSVYQAVARRFLTPVGRVIDAERATWGIYYACLSYDFDMAFYWTSILVWGALQKNLTQVQISALLSRLDILPFIQPRKEFPQQFAHGAAMLALSLAYGRIGEHKKAVDVFEKVTLEVPSSINPEYIQSVRVLKVFILIQKAMSLCLLQAPNALQMFCQIEITDLDSNIWGEPGASEKAHADFLDLLAVFILRYPLADLSPKLIGGLIKRAAVKDRVYCNKVMRLASDIGIRAKSDGLAPDSLDEYFIETPHGEIMKHTAKGTLLVELRENSRALEEINRALELAKQHGLTDMDLWALLHQVKGDAAYQTENNQFAEEAYGEALKSSQPGSFEYGWACWRLGLIKNDEKMLGKGAVSFQRLKYRDMWARALGARGALLIQAGKQSEGLHCFQSLVDSYFIEKEELVGPAVTIAQAHLSRLKNSLEGHPIPETELNFPQYGADIYSTVLDSARPRVGPVVAFFSLAETYGLLGNQLKAQNCFAKALSFTPEHQLDKEILPMVIKNRLDALLDPKNDRAEIKRCVQLMLKCQSLDIRATPPFLSHLLFSKVDNDLQTGMHIERLGTILDLIEEGLRENASHKTFWEGEVLIRRAKLLEARNGDKSPLAEYYREALEKGRASENGAVIISSAHALGVELATLTRSMKELAGYQFALIEGIEAQNTDYERLTVIGKNLFNLWRSLTYRRLSESDLNTKKYLMDSAKEMDQAAVPAERAGIGMVLLLSRLFGHFGPAVDWAKAKLDVQISNLPEHVSNLLS